MSAAPSANGPNGRDSAGRFVEGNVGGPGNPHAKEVARLRSAMLSAVSVDDLREIVAKLVEEAKGGSIPAAKEILDRCLGRNLDLGKLTSWSDGIQRDAKREERAAEREAINWPESLLLRVASYTGLDPKAIEAFLQEESAEEPRDVFVQLADAYGADEEAFLAFLDRELTALETRQEQRDVPLPEPDER